MIAARTKTISYLSCGRVPAQEEEKHLEEKHLSRLRHMYYNFGKIKNCFSSSENAFPRMRKIGTEIANCSSSLSVGVGAHFNIVKPNNFENASKNDFTNWLELETQICCKSKRITQARNVISQ